MQLKQKAHQHLPEGYKMRPATMSDIDALVIMLNIWNRHHIGRDADTPEELRRELTVPGFDIVRSTRVLLDAEDNIVGYVELWDTHDPPVRPFLWSCFHPDLDAHTGLPLLHWGIERSHEVIDRVPAHARVVVDTGVDSVDKRTEQMLQAAGFTRGVNSFLKMSIMLEDEPAAPTFPDGITVMTYADWGGELVEIVKVKRDTFQDHRNHVESPLEKDLERYQHMVDTDPKHDPTLWFLAMDGDRIAGISLCTLEAHDNPDQGYVATLGVRREYRRQGIAQALLRHSFNTLWGRGKRAVALHVDGSSITGATRIYERAGMHREREFKAYELELRPGVELSNQG